jgi:hypothetical protein
LGNPEGGLSGRCNCGAFSTVVRVLHLSEVGEGYGRANELGGSGQAGRR